MHRSAWKFRESGEELNKATSGGFKWPVQKLEDQAGYCSIQASGAPFGANVSGRLIFGRGREILQANRATGEQGQKTVARGWEPRISHRCKSVIHRIRLFPAFLGEFLKAPPRLKSMYVRSVLNGGGNLSKAGVDLIVGSPGQSVAKRVIRALPWPMPTWCQSWPSP